MAFKHFSLRLRGGRDRVSGVWDLLRPCSECTIGARPRFGLKVHVIERTNPQALDECFYHLRYLAKVRDKQLEAAKAIRDLISRG